MRKIMFWINAAAVIVFAVDICIMGLKIFNGSYDVVPYACIGLVCLSAIVVCGVSKALEKCPDCGKVRMRAGEYCPHCGKKPTQ